MRKAEITDEYDIPYIPSTWHKIQVMLDISAPQPYDKMADLGSGDGRVVIEFAKSGIESHGYEYDPSLILLSESNILKENLDEKAFIHPADFWEEDLSSYSIIVIYGMFSVMDRLEEKLKKELKPGSKVISSIFHFHNWAPVNSVDNVHLYIVH